MREIKFRAWDEGNKVMHNNFEFISSGNEGNDWIVFISDKFTLKKNETNPFHCPNPYFSQQLKKMQYTGLKDINGVEIYEGDIIAFSYVYERGIDGDFRSGCGYVKSCTLKGIFVWNDIDLRYEVDMLKGQMPYVCLFYNEETMEDIKVIGNIYENPELLEQSNG